LCFEFDGLERISTTSIKLPWMVMTAPQGAKH
jgi:hypothetical protein